jgi:hypothetical protein
MGDTYTKYFPGNVTLADTCRSLTDEVIDGEPKQLKKVEGIIYDNEDGSKENLNEATFEKEDDPLAILDILNDFVCVDVSTPQGAADAAAASQGRINIAGPGGKFDIWVADVSKPVQILGKHT